MLAQLRTAYGKYRQDPGVTAAMTRPVIDPVQVAIQEYRVFLTWGFCHSGCSESRASIYPLS